MRQLDETSINQILEVELLITHSTIPKIAPGENRFRNFTK